MADQQQKPLVAVLMGSKSDQGLMQAALDMLTELGIAHEVSVISAHRNPEKVRQYASGARDRGLEVIIAGAGASAHLAGVLASWTTLPVIAVPLPTSDLKGVDSLLSMVQMPGGIPVACMAIGTAGAKNAAILSGQILALKYPDIRAAVEKHRKSLSA